MAEGSQPLLVVDGSHRQSAFERIALADGDEDDHKEGRHAEVTA
jgi:hypothetical protein